MKRSEGRTLDLPRREALRRLAVGSAWLGAAAWVRAEPAWPAHPITYVVPYPAGGVSDLLARITAQALSKALGVAIVIDNRPGAAGILGTDYVVRKPADGYTLLSAGTGTLSIAPHLMKIHFDPATALQTLANLAMIPSALVVRTESPYKSVNDLVAAAKARPGTLTYGSGGNGTLVHISGELFAAKTGAVLNHIPYKGEGPALQDVMAGQVDMMFSPLPSALPQLQAGRLRALAVTSRQRSKSLPQIPSMIEAGVPDYEAEQWLGVSAPAGLPPDIARRLENEIVQSAERPDFSEFLARVGGRPLVLSAAADADFERRDSEYWGRIVQDRHIRLE